MSFMGGGEFRVVRSDWISATPARAGFYRYMGLRHDPLRQDYEHYIPSLRAHQEADDMFECETDGLPSRELAKVEICPYAEPADLLRVYDLNSGALLRVLPIPKPWIIRTCADLDGDGLDDLLLQRGYYSPCQYLALRGFDGARIGQVTVRGDGTAYQFVLGQFDHDPYPEIFTLHDAFSADDWCSVADLQTGASRSHFAGHWETLRVADVNQDGRDEVLIGRYQHYNFGIDSYLDCWDVAWWWQLWSVRVGDHRILDAKDLDGNGTVEVVTSAHPGSELDITLLHGGTGLPARSIQIQASRGWPVSVVAADFDEDGQMELVWEMEEFQEDRFSLITDAATGQREWEERSFFVGFRGIDLGDLDRDGRMDLLALDGNLDSGGSLAVLNPETFVDASNLGRRLHEGLSSCTAADVDGDGWDEALSVARTNFGSYTQLRLYAWNGSQLASSWSAGNPSWNGHWGEFVDTLDLEGNGDVEIVIGLNSDWNDQRAIHRLAVVDYPSGAVLAQWNKDIRAARLLDHDEDGDQEILELHDDGVEAFDPRAGALASRLNQPAATSLNVGRKGNHGLILVGTEYGRLWVYETSPQGLRSTLSIQVSGNTIRASAYDAAHNLILTISGGVARVHDGSTGALLHESQPYLYNFGRDLQVLPGARPAFLVSDDYTLYCFDVP